MARPIAEKRADARSTLPRSKLRTTTIEDIQLDCGCLIDLRIKEDQTTNSWSADEFGGRLHTLCTKHAKSGRFDI